MQTTTLQAHFNRLRVLEAARDVFADRGIAGTSVEHLLRAAKVSRRTFYRYFRNKEQVLAGLYALACEVLLTSIRDAIAAVDDPIDKYVPEEPSPTAPLTA